MDLDLENAVFNRRGTSESAVISFSSLGEHHLFSTETFLMSFICVGVEPHSGMFEANFWV